MLAAFLRWLHRDTFVAAWDTWLGSDPSNSGLRTGNTRYSPVLHNAD